ncbi:MAG: family 43 glycosylhydrolase, partial [Sphaerochaeta sp.]
MHPILCGFNPDPSICKVEDIYYLVTSTFEFFPGLPIYASTDLITWELVSHVVYRQDQFSFDKMGASRGLFAPTIRFHKGTFYVT